MISKNYIFLTILIFSAGLVGGSQAEASSNLYRNKTHAFSIQFPTGWHQRNGRTPHTVVASENKHGESIIIQVYQLPQNSTLDTLSDGELRDLIKNLFSTYKRKFKDARIQESGLTYINNEKAVWLRVTYSIKQAFVTHKVTTQFYLVLHGRKYFQILCSASAKRYSKVSNTLLNSVRSFLFEETTWYRR